MTTDNSQPWTDGHLDLAYTALHGRDLRAPLADDSNDCICLPSLRAANVDTVFATVFTAPQGVLPADHSPTGAAIRMQGPEFYAGADDVDGAYRAGMRQIEMYEALERDGELRIVRSASDLEDTNVGGGHDEPNQHHITPRIVILMEGADPIRSPDDVAHWHQRGLRLVGLTWAMGTRYAGGNAAHGPLTAKGRDVVQALDAHGIIHDASHLADDAFDGLFACATGPIVATHSNCRALMSPGGGDDQRHLRDNQIRSIGQRGGIIGLNLYTRFLTATDRRATLTDCINHVQHVADVMGHRRGVALGSDADGGFGRDGLPIDVDHPTRFENLANGLRDAGWSDDEINGFRSQNWQRFLQSMMK